MDSRTERSAIGAIVIDDLRIGDGSGVLNDGASNGVDPILLLLLGIGDEVHRVGARGELERVLLVDHILRALHRQARRHRNDAARLGGARDGGVLEPEELPLLQHEPPPSPRLDVLALLRQPTASLWIRPELHAVVVVRLLR